MTCMKDTKKCRICKEVKPISRYTLRKETGNYRTECKDCQNARRRELKSYKKWSAKNKNHLRKYERNYRLEKKYGINSKIYEKMLEDQGNCCAICGSDKPHGKGMFHVDHCHNTGKVRGLLCHFCNTGLGKFKDDKIILKKAIEYLDDSC